MSDSRPDAPVRDSGGDRSVVAVLNAGSSSLKYELVAAGGEVLAAGLVERVGAGGCSNHQEATAQAFDDLSARVPDWQERTVAVGHRLVHGGATLWQPTRIDGRVLSELEAEIPLAPLHTPAALQVIRAALQILGGVPHIAVFDTGFHHDLPAVARTYALPPEVRERFAIRRYGFHGISVEYVTERLARLAPGSRRAIVCHLGAGASITAVCDGKSRDTSMGFTPLEGLPMATRSGDLDPSIPLFLQSQGGWSTAEVSHLLEHDAGLKGVGGGSGDFREIEARAGQGDERARLAFDLFAYRIRKYVGAYWAALEGLDALVFTAGIGEHSATLRAAVVEPLGALGLNLDPRANAAGAAERRISPPEAQIGIWVIPTDESAVIARHARAFAHRSNAEIVS